MGILSKVFQGGKKSQENAEPQLLSPPVIKNINENGDCRCMNCHLEFWYDDFLGLCTSKKCSNTDVFYMDTDTMDFAPAFGPRQILLRPETRVNYSDTHYEEFPVEDILKGKSHTCPTCRQRFYFYACPHCRKAIPRLTKEELQNTIAPAGIGSSGKSIYMTVLIRHLLNNSIIKDQFKVISHFSEHDDFANFLQKNNRLYKEQKMLQPTQPGETPKPYLLRTITRDGSANQKTYTLWYDYSGESFELEDDKNAIIQYFTEVGGILLFLDPTNSEEIVSTLNVEANNPEDGADCLRDQAVLHQVVNIIDRSGHHEDELQKKLVAVVVNKVDIFKGTEFSHFGPDSHLWQKSPHYNAGEFCIDDFREINREVKDYVETYHPEISGLLSYLANDEESNIGYFGVSSLGHPPAAGNKLEEKIEPIRVEDPFYWMLWKMGKFRPYDAPESLDQQPQTDIPPDANADNSDFSKSQLL